MKIQFGISLKKETKPRQVFRSKFESSLNVFVLWIPYLGLSVVLNPTLAKLAPLSSTRATILDFLPSLQGSTDGDHGVTLGMNYEIFLVWISHARVLNGIPLSIRNSQKKKEKKRKKTTDVDIVLIYSSFFPFSYLLIQLIQNSNKTYIQLFHA